MTTVAAIDLGAGSGRVAVGRFDGERLEVEPVHRFANVPVRAGGTLYWDVLRLYDGIVEGLRAASQATSGGVDSIGADTWGVDFALLDRAGRLVGNPVHYRDARSKRGMQAALARIPARDLYVRTGIQLMPINTVFQLAAMVADDDPALDAAETLVMIPDLIHRWLGGPLVCEFTNATTTACVDPRSGSWATDVVSRLGIPSGLFPEIVEPGHKLGPLRDDVAEQTGLRGATVVAPATHDTGSAVAAVPFRDPHSAYISAGTWSLVGVEVGDAVIDDRTFASNLTNEGGVGATFRLLRNVTGLWLLHECRRAWARDGVRWSFADLVAMAAEAPRLKSLVDPDDAAFASPADMPGRIAAYCEETGQDQPVTPGETVRCALESIALAHRRALEALGDAVDSAPPEIHVVGGGAQNRLLCQWTADATGIRVLAGPAEATLAGNVAVQLLALGEFSSLDEARTAIRDSWQPAAHEPNGDDAWNDAYARFEAIAERRRGAPEAVST